MKVLLLTPQLPYPPVKGTQQRNYHLLRLLAVRHAVDLLSFSGEPAVPDQAAALHGLCGTVEVVIAPQRQTIDRVLALATPLPDLAHRLRSDAFTAALRAHLAAGAYDAVQIEGLELAPYIEVMHPGADDTRPVLVLDEHNVEYLLQRRAWEVAFGRPDRWPAALYSFIQWRKLVEFEAQAARQVDRVMVVSDAEAAALRALAPRIEPFVVPNGVDTDYFDSSQITGSEPTARPELVFTGTMDFRPNIDAVLWFCREVFPRIQAALPAVHFTVVGHRPPAAVRRLDGESITVTGSVPDVRLYLARAWAYVVPMRFGGGVRFKVLEALAWGLPVVSTTLGADGIDVADGVHFLRADGAESFARAAVRLLEDRQLAGRLASAGQALVRARYAWPSLAPKLDAAYSGIAARNRTG